MFGIVQKTKKVLPSVGNSRDDWKIINAFIEVLCFGNFKVTSSFDVLSLIFKISPFILYNKTIDKHFLIDEKTSHFFHFINFCSKLNNFYLADSITRNSKVMSLCFNRFRVKNYNFF